MSKKERMKRGYLQICVFLVTFWLLNGTGGFLAEFFDISIGNVFVTILIYAFWFSMIVLSVIAAKELTKDAFR